MYVINYILDKYCKVCRWLSSNMIQSVAELSLQKKRKKKMHNVDALQILEDFGSVQPEISAAAHFPPVRSAHITHVKPAPPSFAHTPLKYF